jgi:hypothetical protein
MERIRMTTVGSPRSESGSKAPIHAAIAQAALDLGVNPADLAAWLATDHRLTRLLSALALIAAHPLIGDSDVEGLFADYLRFIDEQEIRRRLELVPAARA